MPGGGPPTPYFSQPIVAKGDVTETEAFSGYYATSIGLAHIYLAHGRLRAKVMGKHFSLSKRQNSDFYFLHYKLLGLFNIDLGYLGSVGLAVRIIDGKKYLVGTNSLQQKFLIGEEIQTQAIPPSWSNRVGKYQVINTLEAMALPAGGLKIQDGFLLAYARTAEGQYLEFVLFPQNDEQAIVAGIGRGLGETVFVKNRDDKEMLQFADINFKKKPYQRKIRK